MNKLDIKLNIALFVLGFICGLFLFSVFETDTPQTNVYLDKDKVGQEILTVVEETPKIKINIEGDRAILWWAVFNKSLDKGDSISARHNANSAVENVYGKLK